jgi:hypothetical protein
VELIKSESKDIVNEDDDRFYYDEEGNVKVDEFKRPIYRHYIQMRVTQSELRFIWKTMTMVLNLNMVPVEEIDPSIRLLEMLAEQERHTRKYYYIKLAVNYFTGAWHICNTARKFHLYSKNKKNDSRLDNITLKMARLLDEYHKILKNEHIAAKVSPTKIGQVGMYSETDTKQLLKQVEHKK